MTSHDGAGGRQPACKRALRVEASSSNSGATLRADVTATGELIGTL